MPMNTKEAAQGRWLEILVALGIPRKCLNRKAQACPLPGCGGTDRFVFDDHEGTGSYFCRVCGPGHGFKLLQRFHGWDWRQAYREVDAILGNMPPAKPTRRLEPLSDNDIARLWKTTRKIGDDGPAANYLRNRGIELSPWPKYLRFAWWKHTPTGDKLPCMVALFKSASGELGTLHRTFLADVTKRRMFLSGRELPKGGAIRLFDVDLCMGIAEGIETALSASILFKLPVWACTSESLLRAWQPPPGAKRITVFGDNDSSFVGQRASHELAWRLNREGYHVTVKIPPTPDTDWNDVLKAEDEQSSAADLPTMRVADGQGRHPRESISDTA